MTKTVRCVRWIQEYFKDNSEGKAIIGISGGKDSAVAAALCVKALGNDRVLGVVIPNGDQKDLLDAYTVCRELDIENIEINIELVCDLILNKIKESCWTDTIPNTVSTNVPARIRMTILYTVAALYEKSRVVNTSNRSEDYVGYSTKFGDAAGDFSPLGNLTVKEVLEIGEELGIPEKILYKIPEDGMCGMSDEEKLGFTYAELDDYLLNGKDCQTSWDVIKKIEHMHKITRHKYKPMPTFTDVDFIAIPEKIILQGE